MAQAESSADIVRLVSAFLGVDGSAFLEIRCRPGARPNVGRPDRTPAQNKKAFMAFLRKGP